MCIIWLNEATHPVHSFVDIKLNVWSWLCITFRTKLIQWKPEKDKRIYIKLLWNRKNGKYLQESQESFRLDGRMTRVREHKDIAEWRQNIKVELISIFVTLAIVWSAQRHGIVDWKAMNIRKPINLKKYPVIKDLFLAGISLAY